MTKNIKYLILICLLFFFSGCLPKQEVVKNILQSNSANIIKNDYKNIQKLLRSFKNKLDKRNPNSYDKKLASKIYKLISKLENNFLLKYKDSILEHYKDYLHIAFSKDEINSRNDYLILGMYYLMYSSYEIQSGHKLVAFEYDTTTLHKLYKNLQIIKWKIKVDRDIKQNYLFITWQNNWQLELEKRIKNGEELSYSDLQNLKYIKNKKETLLDPSNFSFEVILTQMIDSVRNSLKALGEEPTNLTVGALRSIFLFL
jgi:hypothetical protein